MKNIITIQHTQSVHHTNGMIGSWTDWNLSELGKEQAERIGLNLSKEIKSKKFIMFTSSLKRASQTANIVGDCLMIKPVVLDLLKERNLGSAVGKSVDWLHKNQVTKEKTIDDKCIHDAESRREVWNRVLPFYTKIMESEDENIIIVSHGDTLAIFNAMWLGLNVEFLNKGDLFGIAGGVSFLHLKSNGKKVISRLCDTYYMRG